MNNPIKDFLAPVREVAGKNTTINGLVAMIEKNGRAVNLIRSLPVFPKMTPEEYEARRQDAIKKAIIFFGKDDASVSDELPEKYEDFLLLAKKHERHSLPIFTTVFPDDWDKTRDIGLCQVEKAAQEYFLPGMNLAAYSEQVSVGPEGAENIGDVIFYSSVETQPFWAGLSRIHACLVAQLNRAITGDKNPSSLPREFIDWMFHGKERVFDDLKIRIQISADQIVSRIVDEKIGNLLMPILLSFFPKGQPSQFQNIQRSLSDSAQFIKNELRIQGATSELEEVVSEVLIKRLILVNVLPTEKCLELYKKMALARPHPHLQMKT